MSGQWIAAWCALALIQPAYAAEPEQAEPPLARAEAYFAEGNYNAAKPLLEALMAEAMQHHAAYGRRVQIALHERDAEALARLFAAHNTFPFEAPPQFQSRVQHYELYLLRRVYNQAIQAGLARDFAAAEQGFSQLLGDPAFHRQAAGWLFRLAMQQKDFERAQFIATLAEAAGEDPALSSPVLSACALQRAGQRDAALAAIKRALNAPGPAAADAGLARQRAVYLAMIRLHVELDQCFLHAFSKPDEARPYFPGLPDPVLSYLARR